MRLADRRGVLTGRPLSAVGERAVQMLMLLDRQAAAEQWQMDLRARIVATHPGQMRALFPEWFPDAPPPLPPTPPTIAEREDLESWLASRMTGQVTGADLADGAGWQ